REIPPPAEEAQAGHVQAKIQAKGQAQLKPNVTTTNVRAKMQAEAQAKVQATAVQAKAQVKEQGKVDTERLLLPGASRNGTSSSPESSDTRAPDPSHAGPVGGSGVEARMKAAPLPRRRSSKRCEQPGFAVVGLVGTFGERVLLLPTENRRRDIAVEATAAAAAGAAGA
ncbi:unnamed protein product, partial [Laminaria digitata]